MTLLFIRHGETALNAARVYQPADTPLSARGQAQAQALALRLAPLGAVGLLSSDMPRALQTAQAVAAATGLPLQTSPLLHERNFGELRGRPHASVPFDAIHMEDAPPGGESMAEFCDRADHAFELALGLRQRLNGPLLVVSHGLLIKSLLNRRFLLSAGVSVPERVGNTSITRESAEPPHPADLVNCTEHLQGQLAEDGRSLSGG